MWVLHHAPVSGTDKVLLLGIANHADSEGGNAWPSVHTLAKYANVSERSVQQSLRKLEESGLIRVRRQAGGLRDTRDDRRPNLYEVVMGQPALPVGVKRSSPRRRRDGVKSAAPRGEARFADGVKPASPEPSREPSENRPRNPTWDAVVEVCGLEGRTLTRSERGRVAKAVSELAEIGATPDEIRSRAKAYRTKWPNIDLTPTALAANYSQVVPFRARPKDTTCACGQRYESHDEEVCQALGGPR